MEVNRSHCDLLPGTNIKVYSRQENRDLSLSLSPA